MNNKALLVGINKYPNPDNELRGCINDINDMAYFISERNKIYNKDHIKMLTDSDATKKGIITQLKWLLEGAAPGDQLLFHYSGHGAQIPTLQHQIEKDGLDEIICPYDFDGTPSTAFRDKEFGKLFSTIPKGVHFVWISDSCHAEDLSRDLTIHPNTSYRIFNSKMTSNGIKPSNSLINNPINETISPITSPLNGVLLSACASNELSADAIINNRFNGAFTYYLIKNLIEFGNAKPLNKLIEYVNKDLSKYGYDQNPQTEGLLENKTFFI